MLTLPPRAEWSIVVVGVPLSPALAFVATVIVAVLLGVFQKAGVPAALAMLLARTFACLRIRAVRVAGKTI
jgi:hypothetical protein